MGCNFFLSTSFHLKNKHMRSLIIMGILFLLFIGVKAQNVVYDENAEMRTVGSFSGIEVSGAISLYLSQGSEAGIAVSAGEEKYNSKIKTEVINGVLRISVDGGIWNGFNWSNKKLKAYVTIVDLNKLEVSGASYLNITGALKVNTLNIEVSGASELKGIINAQNLHVDLSGASVVRVSGTATDANIEASGASRLIGYELSVDNCKVSTSGASGVRLTVNKQISANASGGSTVYYKGPAEIKMLNSSGGASIKNKTGNDD